ncbi:SLC13 family permease [Penaeicola halotolerans]|uniref:SLC13 family permease n=1 Tax=Penaeicola halotolerans TaxID=2793196 RepID=UPI001CF8F10D|nr:SLC13 family permease [Penaeicola halotolerans]
MDLLITVAIIAIGIFLFVKDFFSIDTTSILIMALFIIAGVLSPAEGFSGFNHPATITLGCMFVVSAGVFKSGLLDGLSGKIIKLAKVNYLLALLVFCLIAAIFSAFINDTAVVALLLPIALSVCRDTGISPSRLLIPISFSALFGGACTLIGTSTNILVSSYASEYDLEPFGMFEFSLPAMILAGVGLTYIMLTSSWLLPKRKSGDHGKLEKGSERYLVEVTLLEEGEDRDKIVKDSSLKTIYAGDILMIIRGESRIYQVMDDTILMSGDHVKLSVSADVLTQLRKDKGYQIKGDQDLSLRQEADDRHIFEVMIPYGSVIANRTLRSLNFRRNYQVSVLAIRHRETVQLKSLEEVKMKEGDMLLLLGTKSAIDELNQHKWIIPLTSYEAQKVNYKKAIPAVLIALGVILAAALDFAPILMSGMVGALLLVLTGILKPQEAYEAIEWKVIFMVAGVLSMGTALEKTGGAALIAQFLKDSLESYDPRWTLSLVFFVTFLSTNVLSSKAAAALMTPIVISLSRALEISEKPLLIAVMFACSLTFMTPVSYPTNTMVYAPGNYKFMDYVKFGTPLNLIIWVIASLIIPLFFPF